MYEFKQFLTSNQRLLVILEDFLSQLNFAENFRIWFFHFSLEIAIFWELYVYPQILRYLLRKLIKASKNS